MEFECQIDKYKHVLFPVRFVHKKLALDKNIKFCLDTGSYKSYISYHQAIELGIQFDKLQKQVHPTELVGTIWDTFKIENFELIIRNTSGILITSPLKSIYVLGNPLNPDIKLPVPGILGYTFIYHYTLVITKNDGRIYFTDKRVYSK